MNKRVLEFIKVLLLGILIGISLVIISICIYKNYVNKSNISNYEENKIIIDNYQYEITFNDLYIDLNDVIEFNDSDKTLYYDVLINEFILLNNSFKIEIKNIPSDAGCVLENISKQVILNDKVILENNYEGCYLINYYSIFKIDKYVGIYYGNNENPLKTIDIFDYQGNKVFSNDKVVDFDVLNYTYKSYQESDKNKILNKYKLRVKNSNIYENIISYGNTSYCEYLCEGEKCC